ATARQDDRPEALVLWQIGDRRRAVDLDSFERQLRARPGAKQVLEAPPDTCSRSDEPTRVDADDHRFGSTTSLPFARAARRSLAPGGRGARGRRRTGAGRPTRGEPGAQTRSNAPPPPPRRAP